MKDEILVSDRESPSILEVENHGWIAKIVVPVILCYESLPKYSCRVLRWFDLTLSSIIVRNVTQYLMVHSEWAITFIGV